MKTVKLFKLKRYVYKNNKNIKSDFDIFFYYTVQNDFVIEKWRYDSLYTLWYIDKKTLKKIELLGDFKTLKEANMYAYKWYTDNL